MFRYAEAQALFQTTKVAATNSKKRADETKDNAIKLLTLAKQSLGDADLDMLKDKSEGIKNQVRRPFRPGRSNLASNLGQIGPK